MEDNTRASDEDLDLWLQDFFRRKELGQSGVVAAEEDAGPEIEK